MAMKSPPHPGRSIKDACLNAVGLNVTEVAKHLKVSRKQFSLLLNERAGISPEMALRLSVAFGTTPELWLNLQKAKDLWDARKLFKVKIKAYPRPDLEEGAAAAVG